jgi:hypothetical protein
MENIKYAFLVGAILLAGAISVVAQTQLVIAQTSSGGSTVATTGGQNGTGKQFSESLANKTAPNGNYSAGGNFTVGKQGFANGTKISGMGWPVDTSALKMHISEAKKAMGSNNTSAAMMHVVAALQELDKILSGNSTNTANATSTASTNTTGMTMQNLR